jgi:hypothetical protein
VQPSRIEAAAKMVDGAISDSDAAIAARSASAESLTPAVGARNKDTDSNRG